MFEKLNLTVPLYVTRENASGEIGTWSIGAYWAVGILLIAQLAIVVWLIIAIWAAVRLVIGWV